MASLNACFVSRLRTDQFRPILPVDSNVSFRVHSRPLERRRQATFNRCRVRPILIRVAKRQFHVIVNRSGVRIRSVARAIYGFDLIFCSAFRYAFATGRIGVVCVDRSVARVRSR